MRTQWWLSTDMIGRVGSPKEAGPFSTRDDAFTARVALEKRGANLSVFEEPVPYSIPQAAIEELEDAYSEWRKDAERGLAVDVAHFLNVIYDANGVDTK